MKRILPIIFLFSIGILYGQDQDSISLNGDPSETHTLIRVYNDKGILLSEINYVNGRPFGEYRYYYNNGKLMEEGEWIRGHQVGVLKRYDKNGNIAQFFNFDNHGNRVGNQLYYYSSGTIRAEKLLDLENKPVKIIRFNSEGKQKSRISL